MHLAIDNGTDSLRGIELLTELQSLSIFSYESESSLTELDLSQNTKLESLSLSDVHLTSLDLNHNTKLHDIYLSNIPELKTLKLNQCTGITELRLATLPSLEDIDLSSLSNLQILDFQN